MQNRPEILPILILYMILINSIALASESKLQAETAKDSNLNQSLKYFSSPPRLQGGISEAGIKSSLSQYESFGFLCAREGQTELPAKVTDVTLRSMAYWQGLKVNDRIIQLHANKNIIGLSVERPEKSLSIALSNQHPFLPSEIAKTGVNGVIQKHYADCWFDAPLAAVASSKSGQSLISSMIRQVSPTLYYVTFLDQPNISWPVDLSTINHYQLQDKALWASILEQACLLRFANTHLVGGYPDQAMRILTGKKVGQVSPPNSIKIPPGSTPTSLSQMADIINRAMHNHEPIVIATKGPGMLRAEAADAAYKQAGINLPWNAHGAVVFSPDTDRQQLIELAKIQRDSLSRVPPLILWGNHVYTVIGFDPNTNMVTLRNPFGSDTEPSTANWTGKVDLNERSRVVQDLGDGVIKLPLDVLYLYLAKLIWTDL